jgi:signal transduction histidine kinase
VRLAAAPLVIAAAAGMLAIAPGPGRSTTYAGSSTLGAALVLGAGLALVGAGLVTAQARGSGRIGDLALLAGLASFAPVYIAWRGGPPLAISLAMVVAGFPFAFLFHLVLAYPSGQLGSRQRRGLVTVVYLEAAVTAGALALIRDPYLDRGCWSNCTINSFLVRSLPSTAHALATVDRWFVAGAAGTLAAISIVRLARGSRPARRRLLPVALPAVLFAASVAARAIELQRTTIEDPFDATLFGIFAVGSAALVLLSGGLILAVARVHMQRDAIARVVAELDEAPAPGSLQAALADAVGDSELQVAYWLSERGRFVDGHGRSVAPPAALPGRHLKRLTRNERTIAIIAHAGAAPDLERQLGPAILLALENEQLQAHVLAQVDDLRASRARIVEAADLERRRLERDLHDGAQQRLLALSYEVRLARASADADREAAAEERLTLALEQTRIALEELRDLAHGIYPGVLAEAGLGAAITSLCDTTPLALEVIGADDRRCPAPIEAAAYFSVVEAVDDAWRRGAETAVVTLSRHEARLRVTIDDDGCERTSGMTSLTDRVGALGGSLTVEPTSVRAELPCA